MTAAFSFPQITPFAAIILPKPALAFGVLVLRQIRILKAKIKSPTKTKCCSQKQQTTVLQKPLFFAYFAKFVIPRSFFLDII